MRLGKGNYVHRQVPDRTCICGQVPHLAADQLAILISKPKSADNPFCHPDNLGVLPPLWLQARLQLTLPAIQEKFSRILVSVAAYSVYSVG